jgi:hypothetical protein
MTQRSIVVGYVSLLAACGGIAVVDHDADVDASTPADAAGEDHFDASPYDAWPPPSDSGTWPKYINEGKDCGLPDVDVNCFASIYTCCNHAVCPGGCLQNGPDAEPYCECAGFTGGCPASTVCCNNGEMSCVAPRYCAQEFPPDYCYPYYDQ